MLSKPIFSSILGILALCTYPSSDISASNRTTKKDAKHSCHRTHDSSESSSSSESSKNNCLCNPSLDEQIPVFAKIVAQKILNRIPLSVADFPAGGVQSLTQQQKEAFRSAESDALSCCLGPHVGWKLGLAAATPSTPALGYTAPIYGELLQNMILVGNHATIPATYALSPSIEADMLFLVGSEAINYATTPAQVLACLKGVFPAIEMAAIGTSTVNEATGPLAPPVAGQLNGQGILQVTNIAGRMFLRTKNYINIHNSPRSLADWETILNGGLTVNDTLVLTTGPAVSGSVPPPVIPHLTNMLKLISLLQADGHKLKAGDIVSPGTAVALRLLSTTNPPLSYSTTYTNLDPAGDVTLGLTFNDNGSCFGCNDGKKPRD